MNKTRKHADDRHDSNTESGYRLISNAARLMRYCAGYIADRKAQQNRWRLYYAVDVDIVKLFMAPDQMTAYANIFDEHDDADTRELLARLLGDFIFRPPGDHDVLSAASGGNMFIVPPHDEEIGRMVFALSQKLVREIDVAEIQLEDVVAKLTDQLDRNDSSSLSQWLIDSAPTLIEVFDGKSGPRSELDRFESLEENRLLHIERYLETEHLWTFPLPMANGNKDDFSRLTELFREWQERLTEHKTPKQTKYGLVRDAYVLAMVEWLNEQMAASKQRVVLITGTHGVLKAAEKYRPKATTIHSRTFGDLYVRHPQSVMVDDEFFPDIPAPGETGEGGSFKLFDWLNLFFPKVIRDGVNNVASINTSLLERIEESADADFKETVVLLAKSDPSVKGRRSFPNSMVEEWRTQIRSASIARRIYTEEESWPLRAKELLDWLKARLADGWTVDQLRHDLANRALQSLSALYSSTVWLGLWSQVGTMSEQVRGIPVLRFDKGYEKAQEYCRRVIEAMKANTPESKATKNEHLNIAEMFSQLSSVDESNYHGHLIHALAYATKGHWHATDTLCKIALRTANELPKDPRELRRGREAAYLLAISKRRLARSVENLVIARQYLQEAQNRENDGATTTDLRFLSEALAIDVAKLNFGYFLNDPECAVAKDSAAILRDATELLSNIDSDPVPDCRSWIRQQTSTNALNTGLILHNVNGPLSAKTLTFIREVLSHLASSSGTDSVDLKDMVSEFIFSAARSVFDEDPSARAEALDKVNKLRLPANLPFDKPREALFRAMAKDGVGAV